MATKKPPKTPRGRALARAQDIAAKLSALPLKRSALPEWRRLSLELLGQLARAGMWPSPADK